MGDVPSHWEVLPLSRIGRLIQGRGGTKADDVASGVACVRYGDLYTRHEYFIRASRSFVAPERSGDYTPLYRGDVLFAGSGETIEDIGKSAVNLLDSQTCCGGDVLILRPTRKVIPEFMGYASGCLPSRHQKAVMGRGVTVMHIHSDRLKRLRLPFPPLPEQAAIARYLAHVDRRIRRYIAAKRSLIALLEEQRQMLIYETVTRGLNASVSLKATGVEWLGEIPDHWDVARIKNVARMESGHTPSRTNPLHWLDDNDIPWVSLNDTKQLDRVDFISDTALHINELGLQNSSAHMLPAGVVVFTRDAAVGKAAITTRPMAVSQHLIAWVCGARISNEYLLRVLYAMKSELSKFTFGATIATIGMDDVRKLVMPVPPLDEQAAIADFLKRDCERIDRAIVTAKAQAGAMAELRQRLVVDVVMGRLDVRDAAARLPDEAEEPELFGNADDLADHDEPDGVSGLGLVDAEAEG